MPRDDSSGTTAARLSHSMTRSRANLWRYRPGTRREATCRQLQEEIFVVLEGTLTVDLAEPPERHELERGNVLLVKPGTILQAAKLERRGVGGRIYGAPPEQGGADFFDSVP